MSIALGLMSGTSADGVDAALIEVRGEAPDELTWSLVAHSCEPHPPALRVRIHDAAAAGSSEELCTLHAELGDAFAEAALRLMARADVAASAVEVVGSHGQTFWHRPPAGVTGGATLQLGDAARLAARTGIDVVSDFRSADVAAGGHGAPLVPWPDQTLFALPDRARVLLNVGGMANLTWVPPRGGSEAPLAFDTGPGNAWLDTTAALATQGERSCDLDGRLAAAGRADPELLAVLLRDAFFETPPPRSTGREHFGAGAVEALARERRLVPGRPDEGWPDLLATLTALTARTAADAIRLWVAPRPIAEVVVTGGGAHNPTLMAALAGALAPMPVAAGPSVLGPAADAREAIAFALLGWAHLRGLPGNVPSVTGAEGPRVLGSFTPAPRPEGR